MKTECTAAQLEFHGLGRRAIVGGFNGGKISSDSGGLLPREVEQRTHILKRLAGCFVDYRHPDQIEHPVESLIKQRVKGAQIGSAISIMEGLKTSLDMEKGGEIARNLEDLYNYMERRLIEANSGNDTSLLDEVSDLLKQIKEAWDAIADQAAGQEPAA